MTPHLSLVSTEADAAAEPRGHVLFLNRSDRVCEAGGTAATERIRVLVAAGHALVRAGVRVLLERESGITVADEAVSGDQAIALAQQRRPDVVLIDADLPGVDAFEATRQIVADAELNDVRVMILSTFESDDQIFGALRAGASGLLPKDAEPAELLGAVRVLARGEAVLAPSLAGRVIAELRSMPAREWPAPQQLEELTAREREVMALVAEGLTNHEIAERLVVSPATARTHVSRAMVKLHARDRAQLVVLAYETGLVPPRAR
jgi:DNA-binding NarL/FixJ family response regulator